MDWRFKECPACAAKPGIPELCASCLKNREAVTGLRKQAEELDKENRELEHTNETLVTNCKAAESARNHFHRRVNDLGEENRQLKEKADGAHAVGFRDGAKAERERGSDGN